jgi:KaiC/GvpD/RAD55 family RecA-like ATPase
MEQQVISALIKDRKAYEVFSRIGSSDSFSPLGRTVLGSLQEYYDTDVNAKCASLELIEGRLLRAIQNPKHVAPLTAYLRGLSGDVSVINVESELKAIHRKSAGSKLSLALANGAAQEEVEKLLAQYACAGSDRSPGSLEAGSLIDVLNTDDLTTEITSNEQFIKLWPRALNDRLDGGALRGHHVLVFARPEVGKTLFAVNLCAGFLHQGLSVLYVGNEEPLADVRDRIRGRLLKVSKAFIRSNRADAASALAKAKLGKLYITEGTTFFGVRSVLGERHREMGYAVVILDQIRNMRVKSDSRTAELEAAGIEARAIAKEFQVLVVSITQAGDSATNKVYLEMSDVDSSKTGIPASADLMIGVGTDAAMKANGMIGLSLCKNKMSGDHARITCTVNFSTGVIE